MSQSADRVIEQMQARIADLEQQIRNMTARPVAARPGSIIFPALLTAANGSGSYSWKEVDFAVDGTFTLRAGGACGLTSDSTTYPFPAFDTYGNAGLQTGATVATGTIVWIFQRTDPNTLEPSYGFMCPLDVKFAKCVTAWSPGGNVVQGHACRGDGTHVDTSTVLNLRVVWGDKAQYCPFAVDDVMAYLPLPANASAGDGLLIGYRQTPLCHNQYEVIYNGSDSSTAPSLVAGFLQFANGRPSRF